MDSTRKPFKINLRLSDFKDSGLEVLTLVTLTQGDVCEEDGVYAPVTKDYDLILSEKRRFSRGDEFPDDRGWVPVG